MTNFTVRTEKRNEFVKITSLVGECLSKSGVQDGIAVVFCPHTTAGITINENADPDVLEDMVMKTSELIEHGDERYRHGEGNSDSHLKSTLTGASETVIIKDGRLQLGTWQGIYLAEFDGPRTRGVYIKIMEG
ncbi:MAG: secondary thiamine-phosphate synthase enzyme YjbQ [Thermodesulfobacteriota bacterium]